MRSGAQQLAVAALAAGCGAATTVPYELAIAPSPSSVTMVATSASAIAPKPKAPEAATEIPWETSIEAATERARRGHLPTLVWLRAEWAAAALEMERTVWRDPAVARAAQVFVPLRLDLSSTEGDAALLAERYDVHGLPAIVVLDATGRRIATYRGAISAADLVATLKTAAAE